MKTAAAGAALDHLAGIHHRDAVGDARDDAEIVGDQDHRHAELALQVGEQTQDLRLDRDVERGRRLVGDDQVGIAHQRHRDHHALAQPARELMRILAEPARGGGDADLLEQLDARARAPRRDRPCRWRQQHLARAGCRWCRPG